MPRFSLSDEDNGSLHAPADDDDTDEPPHPIGFGSPWGRTWIGLEPPSSFLINSPGRNTYGLDDDDDDEYSFMTRDYTPQQSYPPLSSYIRGAAIPALLKYRNPEEKRQEYIDNLMEDDDVLLLQRMLKRQSLTRSPALSSPPMKALAPFSETVRRIEQMMQVERQRMEQQHLKTTQQVKSIVLELEQEAATVLKTRQREEDEARRKQEAQDALQLKREQEIRNQQEREQRNREEREAAENERKLKEEKKRAEQQSKVAAKTEYVAKAKKLVHQLVAVRESIAPFEKNKAVSKRRLGMKKVAGGKLNTLSENVGKIQEVAAHVSNAISEARSEDEQIKQALERKEAGYTSDMTRGKRYLVDLLASNTIQRVQAEGFNGPRGDGFPLANMLAMVSLENKELVPILAAHVYTVCPTAIPTLPTPASIASEDELMESLGMQKGNNGEFETFDRFLSRTEVSAKGR